ncbi:MAG: hypothetical protein ACI80V_002658 [Rhodothermales bacterium]
MTWSVLAAMLQIFVLPLAAGLDDTANAAYGDWLMDRGASRSDVVLERALDFAAHSRHSSLESFVRDFVGNLDSEGRLDLALEIFSGQSDPKVDSADELVALILADLRSLTPKDPVSVARLTSADQAALLFGSRPASFEDTDPVGPPIAPLSAAADGFSPPVVAGMFTSIQALGP